jgi:hypothetical protein
MLCALFALCGNTSDGVVDTGLFVLGADGWVPACQRCADKLGYSVVPWSQVSLESNEPNDSCVESTRPVD